MGISTVGEGCKRQMEPIIEDIVNNVLPFLGDSVSQILNSFFWNFSGFFLDYFWIN